MAAIVTTIRKTFAIVAFGLANCSNAWSACSWVIFPLWTDSSIPFLIIALIWSRSEGLLMMTSLMARATTINRINGTIQLEAVGGVSRTFSKSSPGDAKMLTRRSVNDIGFTVSVVICCSSMEILVSVVTRRGGQTKIGKREQMLQLLEGGNSAIRRSYWCFAGGRERALSVVVKPAGEG